MIEEGIPLNEETFKNNNAKELIQEENPLLTAPNCIVTPHIAWASKECRERILATTINNIKAYMSNSPQNVVN